MICSLTPFVRNILKEFQYALFNCNQLLYKAFNGVFPSVNTKLIDCSITPLDANSQVEITKEILLKLLSNGLSDRNILKRLFSEQMDENAAFPEAEGIVWELKTNDNIHFNIITSENLIKDADFPALEFGGEFEEIEEMQQSALSVEC